jgi:phosphatidylglycerol lysyltransferase
MSTVFLPGIPEVFSIDNNTLSTEASHNQHIILLEDKPVLHSSLHTSEKKQLELLAYSYGLAPESYDLATSTESVWRTTCHNAAMSLFPDGKYWHIPGGIISSDGTKQSIIHQLKQQAIKHKKLVAVYSVLQEDLPYYINAGFVVNKFGEEPIVNLSGLTWGGKDFEWVRRQTNYCERQGLEFLEITNPAELNQLSTELMQILHEDLQDRIYSRPLKLLEGIFNPTLFFRKRLFIARQKSTQRIEGFVACSPMADGQEWALESYRKRPSAPRGTTAYLFRKVMDQLKNEGVNQVSLCLIPGKGVELDQTQQTDKFLRLVLGIWYHRLNFLFNLKGQQYFKSRFRPAYRDRYLCVYPHNSLLSILSFVKKTGALCPNYYNLLQHSFSSIFRFNKHDA